MKNLRKFVGLLSVLLLTSCGSAATSSSAAAPAAGTSVAGLYTKKFEAADLSADNMGTVYSFIRDGNATASDTTFFLTQLALSTDNTYVLIKQYHFDYYENYRADPTTTVVTNAYCIMTFEGTYTHEDTTVTLAVPTLATGHGYWGEQGEIAFQKSYCPDEYRIPTDANNWVYHQFAGATWLSGELTAQTVKLDIENATMDWVVEDIA